MQLDTGNSNIFLHFLFRLYPFLTSTTCVVWFISEKNPVIIPQKCVGLSVCPDVYGRTFLMGVRTSKLSALC